MIINFFYIFLLSITQLAYIKKFFKKNNGPKKPEPFVLPVKICQKAKVKI